jgi:hypothetical protein
MNTLEHSTACSVVMRQKGDGISRSYQTGLHVCGMNFNVVCIVNAPLVRRPWQPVDRPAT